MLHLDAWEELFNRKMTSTDGEQLQVKTALFEALREVAIESGIYKNILQEITDKAGLPRPEYYHDTNSSESGHDLPYKCKVEFGGITSIGEPAATEYQAERNAAMAALSSVKNSEIPINKSSSDWSPFCSCGHGRMALETSNLREFWRCPKGGGGCGRRIWIDELLFEDIFPVQSDGDVSESYDSIDELKDEFGKFSASIKCDVDEVRFAIDNLNERVYKMSASMDAIELKEKFVKLSASIKCEVDQVRFGLHSLNEKVNKMSASMEKIEEAISSVMDFFRSKYLRFFAVLIFLLFVGYIGEGK